MMKPLQENGQRPTHFIAKQNYSSGVPKKSFARNSQPVQATAGTVFRNSRMRNTSVWSRQKWFSEQGKTIGNNFQLAGEDTGFSLR